MPGTLLDLDTFLVKEHVAIVRLTDSFSILNPETGEEVGQAEETISALTKVARLFINKHLLPTRVEIRDRSGALVAGIWRGVTLFRPKVMVCDGNGAPIGYFKSKLFSIGGGFWVYDLSDRLVAEIKGDWKGWNFEFKTESGATLGRITKQWAGLGKELFTSADNYVVQIDPQANDPTVKRLLLAAAIAIDSVFRERQR